MYYQKWLGAERVSSHSCVLCLKLFNFQIDVLSYPQSLPKYIAEMEKLNELLKRYGTFVEVEEDIDTVLSCMAPIIRNQLQTMIGKYSKVTFKDEASATQRQPLFASITMFVIFLVA